MEAARVAEANAKDALADALEKLELDTDDVETAVLAAQADAIEAKQTLATARNDADTVEPTKKATDAQLQANVATAQKAIDDSKALFAVGKAEGADEQSVEELFVEDGKPVKIFAVSTTTVEEGEEVTTVTYTYKLASGQKGELAGYLLAADEKPAEEELTDDDVSSVANSFTLKQLQNKIAAAEKAYAANVAKATDAELATQLNDAIALYIAQNGDIGETAVLGELATALQDFVSIVTAEDFDADETDDANDATTAYEDAQEDLYTAIAEAFAASLDEDGESLIADNARGDAVEALLKSLNTRVEQFAAIADAEDAFNTAGNELAGALADALDAVQEREGLIDDVTAAEELAAALEGLFANVEAATAAREAAEEALGAVLSDIDSSVAVGTEDADLFLFNLDEVTELGVEEVSVLDLAAGDQIYFGSAFTLGDVAAADNNAVEAFIVANGDNTVITLETVAYGFATKEVFEVTLVGVSAEQVSFADGLVTIA